MADKQIELENLKHEHKIEELEFERETRLMLLEKELNYDAKIRGLINQNQQYYQQPPQQFQPQQPQNFEDNQQTNEEDMRTLKSQRKYGGKR